MKSRRSTCPVLYVCKDTYQKSPYSSSFHHADSRDSHPSRYESHRTPRYSSDPDKEMEFPAHLEVVRLLVTQSMSVVFITIRYNYIHRKTPVMKKMQNLSLIIMFDPLLPLLLIVSQDIKQAIRSPNFIQIRHKIGIDILAALFPLLIHTLT